MPQTPEGLKAHLWCSRSTVTGGEHSFRYLFRYLFIQIFSTGCSLGAFLLPETLVCVQEGAVPIAIAYKGAAPGNSSLPHIAEPKGHIAKACEKKAVFTSLRSFVKAWLLGKKNRCCIPKEQPSHLTLSVLSLPAQAALGGRAPFTGPQRGFVTLLGGFPLVNQWVDYAWSMRCSSAAAEVILIILQAKLPEKNPVGVTKRNWVDDFVPGWTNSWAWDPLGSGHSQTRLSIQQGQALLQISERKTLSIVWGCSPPVRVIFHFFPHSHYLSKYLHTCHRNEGVIKSAHKLCLAMESRYYEKMLFATSICCES